ncbi:protein SMG7-like isoform X1 [Pieris brassicae]|uniref:protein SMG7-like isoform X1 n=1 Tax=Pieris brassicae TaxID=7116 RepID=UPI001E66011D|nr:protein SMG7-like isoform X1 [Pieris brassicae]
MVLNAAAQVLRDADELKQKVLKCNSGTSLLQDRSLWATQQQLQKAYQKVLTLDLDYALEKKVEQDLWNVGFKQQIEALQAISKDRKNAQRSEGQAMLSWVLQAAAGFYLCLLHQICTTYKLDLPFRRRASLVGAIEGWEVSGGMAISKSGVAGARYACQHCLVHLGDLARYRQQLRVAHTFYRHALAVSPHSGQPYNQLALVAWRRGRRLAAVYWHVRSLLVRAPFPPAPANLARTLAVAASRDGKELPILPVLSGVAETKSVAVTKQRLDSHSYVTELLRALHFLHNVEHLDSASELINTLNYSLSPLIATDSFDSLTLIKMACVIIWIVHSTTEDLTLDSEALTESEGKAAQLTASLAAATLLALLLPAYAADELLTRTLPTLKIFLQWMVCQTKVIRTSAWKTRPQIWAALAHVFNKLGDTASLNDDKFDSVPLPEDEELNGFLPLEDALKGLTFENHTYQDLPESDGDVAPDVSSLSLVGEPELEHRVRARRLMLLGKKLTELFPEYLTYSEDDDKITFTASAVGGDQLSEALETLSLHTESNPEPIEEIIEPPPPIIISEADFREKVREKRVGILKPQGSLERAREERALATTSEEITDTESSEAGVKTEDKKESRKPRVNIAMAAIMRKQEETNKQVKFVTPPPTPDSTDLVETKDDKPITIQPKAIKSLAKLPIGRKTGGILSLKDKSAGYPHLVNAEPEPKKVEEKKEPPPNQNLPQRQESPWQQNYEAQRLNYQKSFGPQNAGTSYSPNYANQGIRLPVVNPKEIDVRTAALQKQNSRQEMFQEGKFQNYQISGDKKNFLNDLPPRFANQYRYWQSAQDSQTNENKFRDENFKANTFQQNWPSEQSYQPVSWWKPEPVNSNYTPPIMPNFYPQVPNMNPYQNVPFNQMPGQNMQNMGHNIPNMSHNIQNLGQNIQLGANVQNIPKNDNLVPNYMQSSIGQMPTLQNLVTSPNFNTSVGALGYNTPSYDAAMYPQFGKFYQPLQMLDKPNFPNKDVLNFGSNLDMQQRLNFNETFKDGNMKPLDSIGGQSTSSVGEPSDTNTYSLFSGSEAPRHALPQQSLWSGPGSPLERLLEQQKQNKHPPAPR